MSRFDRPTLVRLPKVRPAAQRESASTCDTRRCSVCVCLILPRSRTKSCRRELDVDDVLVCYSIGRACRAAMCAQIPSRALALSGRGCRALGSSDPHVGGGGACVAVRRLLPVDRSVPVYELKYEDPRCAPHHSRGVGGDARFVSRPPTGERAPLHALASQRLINGRAGLYSRVSPDVAASGDGAPLQRKAGWKRERGVGGGDRIRDQISANTALAAAIVASTSSSVCASDMKPASYWLGAR